MEMRSPYFTDKHTILARAPPFLVFSPPFFFWACVSHFGTIPGRGTAGVAQEEGHIQEVARRLPSALLAFS